MIDLASLLGLSWIALLAGTGGSHLPARTNLVARAIDTAAVMKPVHEFVASFNKGDATTTDAGCAHVTSIIDEFPPHEWHGPDACQS